MRVSGKRIALGAAALSSALVIGIAGTASAAVGFHAVSTSGKSEIGGNYEYKYAGQADTDNPRGGGKNLYDGKFTNASATDRVGGDGVESVLALAYDEYKNGVWSHKTNVVAVVNGTRTWTFSKKADVKAYACDRAVNTTRLLNCKAAW